jgi:hypothetical protein
MCPPKTYKIHVAEGKSMLEQEKAISDLLSDTFATDQNFHIRQMPDGNYIRCGGALTSSVVSESIRSSAAVGPYQKNIDSSVNWLCFDFDVKKEFLDSDNFSSAMDELNFSVDSFCNKLKQVEIPYLLEFSGQRGMHVWILFSERINYKVAYEITQNIKSIFISASESGMIAVDLFPKARVPSGGVGLGVKIPLSRHVKSGFYSLLVPDQESSASKSNVSLLTNEIIAQQLTLLQSKKEVSKSYVEKVLGVFFDLSQDSGMSAARVKSIFINQDSFSIDCLISHWSKHGPLKKLVDRFSKDKALSHVERMLLVGFFINLKSARYSNLGEFILLKVFSKTSNYDEEKSRKALRKLQSFHFPSQQQIESVTGEKFNGALSLVELLGACVPCFSHYVDGIFDFSLDDIEVTRAAEINYIFQNDEVQSARLIAYLSSTDGDELLSQVNGFVDSHIKIDHYIHTRNEPNKQRQLITLGAVERLATSVILKQLIYFFDFKSSDNSFGYQVNPGFKDRYIFKPWLNLWVEFVAGISSVVEDVANEEFYVVKADISKFYDEIPHEPIKRLLLGGVNGKIDKKLETLTADSMIGYRKIIDVLFKVNSTLSNAANGRGLPQGPAYARFLAELYLDNIDSVFDSAVESSEVLFYRRYVDDVFIICRTQAEAAAQLSVLKKLVQNLGLVVNDEKTKITQISKFSEDFQRYRAQSKYTVDRASRNYEQATNTQKNLAIDEFIAIIQADTCEDDLAFVFSHLSGVAEVEHLKAEKVIPTLKSGVGRGSLFRHLFNFVVEKPERWNLLAQVDRYDSLQSEVFTSVVLSHIGSLSQERVIFDSILVDVISKLEKTRLVQENICLLKIMHGVELDISDIEDDVVLNVLSGCTDPLELHIDSALVQRLTLSLNAEQSLTSFVNFLYPLSMCPNTSSETLNLLAQIFYAKISNASRLNLLSIASFPGLVYEVPATRLYHLLCLFSLSDANEDLDVLKAVWAYCIELFNEVGVFNSQLKPDNWFKRLPELSVSHPKSNVVITAIIDGSICRGVTDTNNLFEMFHGAIIIFLAGNSTIKNLVDVKSALEKLKERGIFYKWVIENEGVHFFPNRNWFEKNAFENNCIILKKNNEILIRKSDHDFLEVGDITRYQNGYGEKIELFDAEINRSLKQVVEGKTAIDRLGVFLHLVEVSKGGRYPNIFSDEKLLCSNALTPFTKELSNLPRILREHSNGDVSSYPNEQSYFISCLFGMDFSDGADSVLENIREKYLPNLDGGIDLYEFLAHARDELIKLPVVDGALYLDLAMAAALYQVINKDDKLLERFVEVYDKFNKGHESKSIYCVSSDDVVNDSEPNMIFAVVSKVLSRVVERVAPSLRFFLDVDVKEYHARVKSIVESDRSLGFEMSLADFYKVRVDVRYTDRLVVYVGVESSFENTFVFNIGVGELQLFSTSLHSYVLRSSEHIYALNRGGVSVLLPISSCISKMYSSIKFRFGSLEKGSVVSTTYPAYQFEDVSPHLNHFSKAASNVSHNRDILIAEAEGVLKRWLSGIPKKFHEGLCALIAGHVVMSPEDVENFISTVRDLLKNDSANAFFIKKIGDFNGAHRILFKDLNIGRVIDRFHPNSIAEGADEVTLIVDNVISGGQVIKALKFYSDGDGPNENYYSYTKAEADSLSEKLKSIKILNLCQVFHTSSGLERIAKECKEFLGPDIQVRAFGGRDIGKNAFFGTSAAISERDKKLLRSLFQRKESLVELLKALDGNCDIRGFSNIDKLNLVARYRSLPKKCFSFLALGLSHNRQCSPFERVLEAGRE